MKKLILILSLLFSGSLKAQYSGLTVIPQESSITASFENIDDLNFGFYFGGYYQIGSTGNPYIYRTPYAYFNRVGINYGILHCGLVINAGIKVDLISGPDAIFYPDVSLKFQPIKMLTKNKDIWDISITGGYADKPYIGFGISIPYRYGSYYR